jgi:hypothetical protein
MTSYWPLSRYGREYYQVKITTEPPITSWDISFDHGTTWKVMAFDEESGYCSYLVSGPLFVAPGGDGATFERLTTSIVPYIRATDNPEVIVRATPRIDLV